MRQRNVKRSSDNCTSVSYPDEMFMTVNVTSGEYFRKEFEILGWRSKVMYGDRDRAEEIALFCIHVPPSR